MQKFRKGDRVKVAKDLGPHMCHFKSDCEAIVVGSYKDKFGGDDTESYTLYIQEHGESSWYEEWQLTLVEINRTDLLTKWKTEEETEEKIKSDLDWIFQHGKDVLTAPHGASIQALASCFGLDNLWGDRGEGITYQINAVNTLLIAKPFLISSDKDGWQKKAQEIKTSHEGKTS